MLKDKPNKAHDFIDEQTDKWRESTKGEAFEAWQSHLEEAYNETSMILHDVEQQPEEV